MSSPTERPLSAEDLRHWCHDERDALTAVGVWATHGQAPRLVEEGPSWVSLSSASGSGRLVRLPAGACTVTAHRYRDGAPLLVRSEPVTTTGVLAELVTCLRRPSTAD